MKRCGTACLAVVLMGSAPAAEDSVLEAVRLAERHTTAGRYADAERALAAALEATKTSGPVGTRRAYVLNNLGFVYDSMGRYLQAEECYQRAIEAWKAAAGDHDIRLIRSTGNLAKLYVETGQFAKAERLGIHALAERIERLYPDDPDLARLFTALGILECSKDRYGEAERYQARALAIWEKRSPGGIETVQVLSNLAHVHMRAGRYREALEHIERSLAAADALPRAGDPVLAALLQNAAAFRFRLDGPAEAEPLFRRALAIAEGALGPEHPLVGRILSNYAVALRQMKKKAEAARCEKRAAGIKRNPAAASFAGYTVDITELAKGR